MTDYIAYSLAWAVLWFAVGCAIGYYFRILQERENHDDDDS